MNRLDKLFLNDRFAIIFYLTVGEFPREDELEIIKTLIESGADCLELGVPFSDPLADGATIQEAMQISLQRGTSLKDVFDLSKEIRKFSDIPLLLMGYYNPFYQFGLERLCKVSKEMGIDGFIIPDLPPEEAGELIENTNARDLRTVFLLAPTSREERYEVVGKLTSGFIYYVSVKGTTGERDHLPKDIEEKVPKIKAITGKPVVVGFGVSHPHQIRWLKGFANGAVIGSALLRIMKQNKENKRAMLEAVSDFVASLANEART
ncbi:tryptophan synthase subunit alpha [bacterium]|nr:tryptophan synthase subunit alpha [bacterium]